MELLLLRDPVLHLYSKNVCSLCLPRFYCWMAVQLKTLLSFLVMRMHCIEEIIFQTQEKKVGSVCMVALLKEIRLLQEISGHLFTEHKRFTLAVIRKPSFTNALSVTYRQHLKSHLKNQMQLGSSAQYVGRDRLDMFDHSGDCVRRLFSLSLTQNSLSLQLCWRMRVYFKIKCLLSKNGSKTSYSNKKQLGNNMGTILLIKSSFVIILDYMAPGMKIGVGTTIYFFVSKNMWFARSVLVYCIFTTHFSLVIFPV